MDYRSPASFKSPLELKAYAESLGLSIPVDEEITAGSDAPLARPLQVEGMTIGNRFCALPMEGWDAEADGSPSELIRRRWLRIGRSGAKLLWMEATAVMDEGRANPRQLLINDHTVRAIAALRQETVEAHRERFGRVDDLAVGLQLTHSGRFSRPAGCKPGWAPVAYRHPILDRMFGLADEAPCLSDSDIRRIIDAFIHSAALAREAGFDFVDVKHCHGYLGHELLSAFTRPGEFGGSFENRTRYLREIVSGIRAAAPGLALAVRLSAFDFVPFTKRPGDGVGAPASAAPYAFAFGGDGSGLGIDLAEPLAFLDLCDQLGIRLISFTAGSPYYNPHIQRPALFPPSDGYLPPEDPLVAVDRLIRVAADLKRRRPGMILVGVGYTYLQEYLSNVAQAAVASGRIDSIGIGRGLLSYPDMAADVLEARPLDRKRICRTDSHCTTAPRNSLVSGCYSFDDAYRSRVDSGQMREIKWRIGGQ